MASQPHRRLIRRLVLRISVLVCLAVLGMVLLRIKDHRQHLSMMVHSKFFSIEVKLPEVIDPQVFVTDASAPATIGAQGIARIAGVRPATSKDPDATEALTAEGQKLGFNLGAWFGASGDVTLEDLNDGRVKIDADFAGLVPNGTYDLFENHFDQRPIGFTPLDGTATTNHLKAGPDGRAHITLFAPQRLTHNNAVLLVYDSDGQSHGLVRGQLGVNAHHQLVARIPES